MKKINKVFFASVCLLGFVKALEAQDVTPSPTPEPKKILQAEGISGDIDKKRRGPVISLSTHYTPATNDTGEKTKILVDAEVPNSEYERYPIKFDFYINRTLYTSQIRSLELPGPIGIEIGSDVATVPFNYSVVATVLHPNREFTSVAQGAVFANEGPQTLNCELTESSLTTSGETSTKVYSGTDVLITQIGNQSFTLSYEADDAKIFASVNVSGEESNGEISTTIGDIINKKTVSGSAASDNGDLKSFSMSSDDTFTKIECN